NQQLRKNLQLVVFLQRLSRGAPFQSQSALDQEGKISPQHRTAAEAGRRTHDSSRANARLPGSRFAEAWRARCKDGTGGSDVVGQVHRLSSKSPVESGALALQIFSEASAQFFFSGFALLL